VSTSEGRVRVKASFSFSLKNMRTFELRSLESVSRTQKEGQDGHKIHRKKEGK
jgi:hypothetical protein